MDSHLVPLSGRCPVQCRHRLWDSFSPNTRTHTLPRGIVVNRESSCFKSRLTRSRSPTLFDSRYYSSPPVTSQALPNPAAAPTLGFGVPQYSTPAQPQTYHRSDSITSASSSSVKPQSSQKEKPQCWEHGCNGREFSTFSNLLRHQREKSGTASKSYCPKCGAEFTRTTARNGHLAHDKCTKRRPSESDR